MQVILKKDIPQLGRIGDLIKVREGYARNFLIPRAYAVPANSGNLKGLEHQKRLVGIHKKQVQKDSQGVAEKMNGISIQFERRFNEAGKMYGALSSTDIATELKKQSFTVDRRDIEFETIKVPGEYPIKVRLPGDVYVTVNLKLAAAKERVHKEEGKRAKAAKATKIRAKKAEPAVEGEVIAEVIAEVTKSEPEKKVE